MNLLPMLLPDAQESISTWLMGRPIPEQNFLMDPARSSMAMSIAMLAVLLIILAALGAFLYVINQRPVMSPEHELIDEVLRAEKAESQPPNPAAPWERDADWWREESSAP